MTTATASRPALVRRALRLEYLTVGWNLVEGVIAIAAAMASGSVALLGFLFVLWRSWPGSVSD